MKSLIPSFLKFWAKDTTNKTNEWLASLDIETATKSDHQRIINMIASATKKVTEHKRTLKAAEGELQGKQNRFAATREKLREMKRNGASDQDLAPKLTEVESLDKFVKACEQRVEICKATLTAATNKLDKTTRKANNVRINLENAATNLELSKLKKELEEERLAVARAKALGEKEETDLEGAAESAMTRIADRNNQEAEDLAAISQSLESLQSFETEVEETLDIDSRLGKYLDDDEETTD